MPETTRSSTMIGSELEDRLDQADRGMHHRHEDRTEDVGEDKEQAGSEIRSGSSARTSAPGVTGSRLTAMRPPSSGRMGRRLSTIRTMLTAIPASAMRLSGRVNSWRGQRCRASAAAPTQGHEQVRERSGRGDPQHVALGPAQRMEIHRHRLRPAEQDPARRRRACSREEHERNDDRAAPDRCGAAD